MDTEKLLTALDILLDDGAKKVDGLLTDLVNHIGQNTPEAMQLAETVRLNLIAQLESAEVNNLAPSYQKILERIGGTKYAGVGALETLTDILDGRGLNSAAALETYLADYRSFISKTTTLFNTLDELGIEPYRSESYDIGFMVPGDLNEMIVLGEKMKMWDRFIAICAQVSGDTSPTVKVTRASNGSIELFIAQSLLVARIIESALKRLMKLYQEFQKIQKTELEIEGLDLENDIKRTTLQDLRRGQEELETRCLEEAANEVFEEHYRRTKGGAGKAELRSNFGVALKLIARDVQQGVEIEVSAPVSTADGDVEEDTHKRISELNKQLKVIYSQPLETKFLPFEVKIDADELRQLNKKPRRSSTKKRKTRTNSTTDSSHEAESPSPLPADPSEPSTG